MTKGESNDDLAALGLEALKLQKELQQTQRALQGVEDQIASATYDRLVEIDQMKDRDKSLIDLDEEIVRELMELRNKYEHRPRPGPPDPGYQWRFMEELYRLLDKLIRKAWRLQGDGDDLPPLPEPPPPPPPGPSS